MTGENDGPALGVELRPHAQAHLVGLPAQQLRVDRLHERVHAIETSWCRSGREPFEIAVGPRDITVRAGRDVDDDVATLRHEADHQPRRGADDGRRKAIAMAGSTTHGMSVRNLMWYSGLISA